MVDESDEVELVSKAVSISTTSVFDWLPENTESVLAKLDTVVTGENTAAVGVDIVLTLKMG